MLGHNVSSPALMKECEVLRKSLGRTSTLFLNIVTMCNELLLCKCVGQRVEEKLVT